MQPDNWTWKIYRFIFLDFWHRQFFHSTLKPQNLDFNEAQLRSYLASLKLKLEFFQNGQKIEWQPSAVPTIYFAEHPSSLDALFIYAALFRARPWIVSYIHNQYHFAFLRRRLIPVAALFKAKKLDPVGLKMKLASRLEDLTEEQAAVINRAVPSLMVEKLAQGQSVVIFPSGGWGEWQDGIGYAALEFWRLHPHQKIQLQPLKIFSFRELHSVLHGWLHLLGIKISGTIKIKVGPVIELPELARQLEMKNSDRRTQAKAIRQWLEKQYRRL